MGRKSLSLAVQNVSYYSRFFFVSCSEFWLLLSSYCLTCLHHFWHLWLFLVWLKIYQVVQYVPFLKHLLLVPVLSFSF